MKNKTILEIKTQTQYLCRIGLVKGDSILLWKINIFNFRCSWLVGAHSCIKEILEVQQCTKLFDIKQYPTSKSLQLDIIQKNIFKITECLANSYHSLHYFHIQRLKLKAIPSKTVLSQCKNLLCMCKLLKVISELPELNTQLFIGKDTVVKTWNGKGHFRIKIPASPEISSFDYFHNE